MPSIVQSADTADIVNLFLKRLEDAGVYLKPNLYPSMKMFPIPHVNAQQYATVVPLTGDVLGATVDGRGRWATRIRERLDVYCWNSLALDRMNVDKEWLVSRTKGILQKRLEVISALHGWYDHAFLACPIELVGLGEPRKDNSNPEWGFAYATFVVEYLQKLVAGDDTPPGVEPRKDPQHW